jgi:hypothetical protein
MSDPSANFWFSDSATWLTDGLILLDGWLNYVSDPELAKELLKPKDWIVGVFSALVVLVLVSRTVLKLRIETRILYEPKRDMNTYSIKVVNKRHSWLAASGDAIDNRADLHP